MKYKHIFKNEVALASRSVDWQKKNFLNHETQELFEVQKRQTTFMKA